MSGNSQETLVAERRTVFSPENYVLGSRKICHTRVTFKGVRSIVTDCLIQGFYQVKRHETSKRCELQALLRIVSIGSNLSIA